MADLAVSYIPNHHTTLFNQNFGHAVQQMVNRLRNYVTIETDEIPGNGKRYDDLDARDDMEAMTERAGATRLRDHTSSSRWLTLTPYDDASVVGKFDPALLGRITNPASDIAKSIDMARNRTAEALILAALRGTVTTGETGGGSSAFPASQQIAANFSYNATTGAEETNGGRMSVDKIRKALQLLGTSYALQGGMASPNSEKPVLALRSKDKSLLFTDITFTSGDYSKSMPYSDGVIEEFFGVRLVTTEQIAISTSARCLMWLPSAIYFAENNWASYIDVRPDLSHAIQVRVEGRMGAMRRYDEKVVEIAVTA
jgi:hypothetical protein